MGDEAVREGHPLRAGLRHQRRRHHQRGGRDPGTYDPAWVEAKVQRLVQTLGEVLDQAQREGRATNRVADEIARERIAGWADVPRPRAL